MNCSGHRTWKSFDIGHAVRPVQGEVECGDAAWATALPEELRATVIDGLGHGPLAAFAAARALASIAAQPWHRLEDVMARCDAALRSTRGAAITLMRVSPSGRVECCGVGNIAVVVTGQRTGGAHPCPGIVGARPRNLVVDTFDLVPGSTLALHTDGVSQRLNLSELEWNSTVNVAEQVLAHWGKVHDDAGCLVLRRRIDD
jgi:hypothetical protein